MKPFQFRKSMILNQNDDAYSFDYIVAYADCWGFASNSPVFRGLRNGRNVFIMRSEPKSGVLFALNLKLICTDILLFHKLKKVLP